ncbi:hypothetical protein PoB_006128400 [Plakobranchus ocellatus]|uniref:ATPase AAA-type core domain-containing protein n=1 Tax=Plakobranchus ocellatus TaxID=259542 RepID=A0AAV4CSE7_9GAST|nr:hypothetical protein PoB_006128400 [Plakobranchus ocellatus]
MQYGDLVREKSYLSGDEISRDHVQNLPLSTAVQSTLGGSVYLRKRMIVLMTTNRVAMNMRHLVNAHREVDSRTAHIRDGKKQSIISRPTQNMISREDKRW